MPTTWDMRHQEKGTVSTTSELEDHQLPLSTAQMEEQLEELVKASTARLWGSKLESEEAKHLPLTSAFARKYEKFCLTIDHSSQFIKLIADTYFIKSLCLRALHCHLKF